MTTIELDRAMTSTHHARSNLESQLYLITDRNMRTVRWLRVCEC